VSAVTSDVIVVNNPVLLENLMKDNASIRRFVFVGTEAHKQVVHLLIDRRVSEELRSGLLGLRIASAQDAKGPEKLE
jgi:hypothetical protein